MITSDPVQAVTDAGDVTLTFGYDLRPGVDRNGQEVLLESYVENTDGELTWFLPPSASRWTKVEAPEYSLTRFDWSWNSHAPYRQLVSAEL